MSRKQIDITRGQDDHEITVGTDGSDMAAGIDVRIFLREGMEPVEEQQALDRAIRALHRHRSR